MKKIAIIGGGITGLSAAFYLEKARRNGADLTYTIFEQSGRLGGALLTEHVDGCIVEGGADSFLTEKPWATELCQDLGIEDQLVGSNDAHRQTFIAHNRKLIPLPAGMTFFVPTDLKAIQASKLFSAAGKKRILREGAFPRNEAAAGDVSVGDFVERHFGSEMLERVADPLLAGIYGGDTRKLSMQSVLPKFLEMERHCGSLIRALAETKARSSGKPLFTSLKNGMQHLVRSLIAQLQAHSVQTDAKVSAIELSGEKWKLRVRGQVHEFDAVLMAAPAYAAGQLLNSVSSKAASLLREIPYSSSGTVALAFASGASNSKRLPTYKGFGFLVAHAEGHRALACTFVQNKFPNRVPPDRALLRVFFGGVHDEAVLQLKDDDLVRAARAELNTLLKIKDEPAFFRVHRWPRAMPQYNVGHKDLLGKIAKAVSGLPGLILAGSAYDGVGVPDCIRQGRDAALQLAGSTRDLAPAT